MGGRFGKYGDMKRKARLRRSIALKAHVHRLKNQSRKLKKNKEIRFQSAEKLKVYVEFRSEEYKDLNGSNV